MNVRRGIKILREVNDKEDSSRNCNLRILKRDCKWDSKEGLAATTMALDSSEVAESSRPAWVQLQKDR